ncbi:unnamed protein product [Polarella glacialis]|uniref:Uncharacterized protein n=1 Tax=Polarella glacialis TaxID=89957 RepID=A0A813J3C4_POLGL|nr:unnamed protein product [Polarella glacialis]CAE8672232.1 unnamed protein product [Polarella glacialis]
MSRSPDSANLRFEVGAVCYSIELPSDPEVPLADTFEAAVAALRLSLGARRPPASSEAPAAPRRPSAAASSAAAADSPTAPVNSKRSGRCALRLRDAVGLPRGEGSKASGLRLSLLLLLFSLGSTLLRTKAGDTGSGTALGFRRWSDVVEVVCEEATGSTRRVPAAQSVFQGFPSKVECEHFVAGAGIQLPINWSTNGGLEGFMSAEDERDDWDDREDFSVEVDDHAEDVLEVVTGGLGGLLSDRLRDNPQHVIEDDGSSVGFENRRQGPCLFPGQSFDRSPSVCHWASAGSWCRHGLGVESRFCGGGTSGVRHEGGSCFLDFGCYDVVAALGACGSRPRLAEVHFCCGGRAVALEVFYLECHGEVCRRGCCDGTCPSTSFDFWCCRSSWARIAADCGWRISPQCFEGLVEGLGEEGACSSTIFFGRCGRPRYARGRTRWTESSGLGGFGADSAGRAGYQEQAACPAYDRAAVGGGSSGRGGSSRRAGSAYYGSCLGEAHGSPCRNAGAGFQKLAGGDLGWCLSVVFGRLWWRWWRGLVWWQEELTTFAAQGSARAAGVLQQLHGESFARLGARLCGALYVHSGDGSWRADPCEDLPPNEGQDCRASSDAILELAGGWCAGGFDRWKAGGMQGASPSPSRLWGAALPRWIYVARSGARSRGIPPYGSFRPQEGAGSLAQPWSALLNPTWASIHLQHLQETESWIEKRKKLAGGAKPKAGASEDGATGGSGGAKAKARPRRAPKEDVKKEEK